LLFLGSDAGFAEATLLDRFRLGGFPNALRPRVFVAVLGEIFPEPAAPILPGFDLEVAKDFEERPRFELADFFFPLRQDRERRRLNAPDRRKLEAAGLVVKRGHRAG